MSPALRRRLATVTLIGTLVAVLLIDAPRAAAATPQAACPSVLKTSMPRLQDEAPQNLCQYAGKVVLVVNTASKCGFTSQYEGLERLHQKYQQRGFVVLGFPSGDFGGQELGSNKEIASFCTNTFGIKFPMFAKSAVRGEQANPVFAELIRQTGESPKWNFHKYLIGRDGKVIGSWTSLTDPESGRLREAIEKSLNSAAPAAS